MIEGSKDGKLNRRLRLGMVGGGRGAFIGAVHRMVARLDDRWEFVAGALSSDPERARASGEDLRLDPARIYTDFAAMAEAEKRRSDRSTPSPSSRRTTCIARGESLPRSRHPRHLRQADDDDTRRRRGAGAARRASAICCSPSPIITPAIRWCGRRAPWWRRANSGALRVVQVEYAQDWLSTALETTDHKQARWRSDPGSSGPGGSLGDIGTHAFNLAEFITGAEVASLAADLNVFVPGRRLDDNAQMLLRFGNGAKGTLWCSQVAVGNENGLRIRLYGEKGGLEWHQENPNVLTFSPLGEPPRLIRRNGAGAMPIAQAASRIPAGHPEGYLEAFAQLYTDIAELIAARMEGREPEPFAKLVPKPRRHQRRALHRGGGVILAAQRRPGWISKASEGNNDCPPEKHPMGQLAQVP